jgi:hypothetical protein
MRHAQCFAIVALAAIGGLPLPALASEPAGVWLIADEVTLLPDLVQPTSVRIIGWVSLHSGSGPINGWGYPGFEEPRRGTLYYTCPTGKEAVCQAEWRELRDTRGSCVGFGSVDLDNGRLHTDGALATPDAYPISMGIVIGHRPCELLKTAAAGGGAAGGLGEAGGGAGAASVTSASAGAPGTPQAGVTTTPPPAAMDAGTSAAAGARATPSTAATDGGMSGSSAVTAAMGGAGKSSTGQAGDGSAHLVSSCAVHGAGRSAPGLACWWAVAGLVSMRLLRLRRRGCASR